MGPVDSVPAMGRAPGESLADDERSPAHDRGALDRRDGIRPPENARPTDTLRQRMDQLPAGHPSSPYDADGSPRQSTARLQDLDTASEDGEARDIDSEVANKRLDVDGRFDRQPPDTEPSSEPQTRAADAERLSDEVRPFSDVEWVEHVAEVRVGLEKAERAGLSTVRQYTIDGKGLIWSSGRDRIHDSLIEDLYDAASFVPCERKAIIAGGLPGAGKTTVLGAHTDIDQAKYLIINPDNIKEELASRGLVPGVDGLSPMEASALVHEESSHIAYRLADRARADGKNIIWDITMSSPASAKRRIEELRDDGYTSVHGLFVEISTEVSTVRADARHRDGEIKYQAGDGLGGRYVPPEAIEAQADAVWGSQNRRTFEEIKSRFDHWTVYDNSVDGHPPTLIDGSDIAEETR
jgi:predicted ABC-type ATPase